MADYATLLRDHTRLTCRSLDRIFLQAYMPGLQTPGQVARFLMQRGYPIPSSAALGEIGEKYVAEIKRWAKAEGVPIRQFRKGEKKEAIAEPLLEAAAKEGGPGRVVLLGMAQEKTSAWRSWRSKQQPFPGRPQMEWGRQMAFVNHFYWYLWDPDWGKAFWKSNAYCPFPIWLWLNGHEWAKRQLEKAGIEYQALDNGFRSCADPSGPPADLRPPGAWAGGELLLALVLAAALALRPGRRSGGLRLRPLRAPVRGLGHPRLRPAPGRPRLLRGPDPLPPRHWPAPAGGAGLRSPADAPHAGQVLHQGRHRGVDPQISCT